ncbi:2-aminoadipate transaminase [Ensifer psoraleae]|uniref:aminotransferase-like domain-containing protein n=1 Tax=Sinorhizobium psoraleae TaxID=520838 RepID=UPI001569E607|nr:PLP-dependent aminotransferase family protein [Sinorhizobium psoraleae]NRP70922.1 2-aminoadipate transaminase [Sinorhizobium psoraleae]
MNTNNASANNLPSTTPFPLLRDTTLDLTRNLPPFSPDFSQLTHVDLKETLGIVQLTQVMRTPRYEGLPGDRNAGAKWIRTRLGQNVSPEDVVVTNGTTMALALAARRVVKSGSIVLTDQLACYGFQSILQFLGIPLVGVAMDEYGLLPDALDAACRCHKAAALFLVPTLHNPTTITMPEQRRLEIIEVARLHGLAILEDDILGLIHHAPPPAFASLAPDITWYATGLSKCVSPGMRVAYLRPPSPEEAAKFVSHYKTMSMWFVAPIVAEMAQQLIENGTAARILLEIRDEARTRQKIARSILTRGTFSSAPEAFNIWLEMPFGSSSADFVEAMRAQRILLRVGDPYSVAPFAPISAARVCLGSAPSRDDLALALHKIANWLEPQISIGAR